MSTQVVLSLIEPLLGKGYCVTTDNFYTSVDLTKLLVERNTDIYGTVRSKRKGILKQLQNKKIEKGEIIAFKRNKIMTMKWLDKKNVGLLSTIHNTEIVTTNKIDNDGYSIRK